MSLVTTCPNCGTVFRMMREQLDASGGWVRCGHCMEVFDARLELKEDALFEMPAPQVGDQSPTSSLSAELSFVQQAKKNAFWNKPLTRVTLVLLCLAMIFLLSIQILRSQRDRIAITAPAMATLSSKLCQLWSCAPIARLQIDGWLLDNSSFQKANNGQFRLGVLLKNNSRSELLVPHLDISLLDSQDAVVIRKSIDLSTDLAGKLVTAASGEERKFDLLLAPTVSSATIAGYRLVLFYP